MPDMDWNKDSVHFGRRRYRAYAKSAMVQGTDKCSWDLEEYLFDDVGTRLSERRPIYLEELCEVARWRGRQSLHWIVHNEKEYIEEVSRIAFDKESPNFLRVHILMILKGVTLPIASSILTLYDPYTFTIVSKRATASMRELGRWWDAGEGEIAWDHSSGHGYLAYVEACRRWSSELNVELRDLDRALWQWNRDSEDAGQGPLALAQWEQLYGGG